MHTDQQRCRILCELIEREPEGSHRADMYVRLLWQILDRQLFPISNNLHCPPVGMLVAMA